MIVTVSPRGPFAGMRWPLVVAAASFSVAVWWPSPFPRGPAPAAPVAAARDPGLARLDTGHGDAMIVPAMQNGAMQGFRLYGVRSASPWARAGLQDGDLVTALAGVDVTDASQILAALTVAPSCEVRFERTLGTDSPVVLTATLNPL